MVVTYIFPSLRLNPEETKSTIIVRFPESRIAVNFSILVLFVKESWPIGVFSPTLP